MILGSVTVLCEEVGSEYLTSVLLLKGEKKKIARVLETKDKRVATSIMGFIP